ncbi:hypothetical protein A3709_20545 [Halioglobus sp. HI00S01]|uniref:TonB-dependent receptor n=1 Tax=Halioglobus sp. HI00S01 TaxID=1822214 RepID=UPI0007C2C4F1|nr:TonB-dependent receptor [Halioglobus sp. HI00S01]KZX58003.1 hypothetical protein A3709_20545 [Halioglobus sp. HI00S01]
MKKSIAQRTVLSAAVAAALMPQISMAQEGLSIKDIIVTAQKRAESVQDVSAVVNVVGEEAQRTFNYQTFEDVEKLTAGVTIGVQNARTGFISIRGISTDPESGAVAAVDSYWNGVVVRPDDVFGTMYDLSRVEILRGPQGTLQGATSPGGAINVITQRPEVDGGTLGYVETTATDDSKMNVRGAVEGTPVEGTLAARLAFNYSTDAGEFENFTTGLDDIDREDIGFRLSATYTPTDALTGTFIYEHIDRSQYDPQAVTGIDSLSARPTLNPDDRTALASVDNDLTFDGFLSYMEWNYEFGNHTITSVTSLSDTDKESTDDVDYADYVVNPLASTSQVAITETDTIIQEFRFANQDAQVWEYIVGLYYRKQDTATDFFVDTTLTPPNPTISFQSFTDIPVNTEEYAIFNSNTLYIGDNTQLEIGLRYTTYDRFRAADSEFNGLTYVPPEFEGISDLIEQGLAATFPIEGVAPEFQESDDDALTGTVRLRHYLTEDINLYAAYNRGYRPGGISIIPSPEVEILPNGQADLTYDEEISDAFEIGFKSRLLDGRAELNGALFYQQFDGYFGFVRGIQVENPETGVASDLAGGLVYNGDATVLGAELEGRIVLTENWEAAGALAFAQGEWDGASAPCNERAPGEVIGSCDIDGEALGEEPELSLSLSTQYTLPLENGSEAYFAGLYKYTDERPNADASAGFFGVRETYDETHIVDAYVGWRSAGGEWDVSLWSKNLLDDDAIDQELGPDEYDLAYSGGSYRQSRQIPERSFGITARYQF